MNNVEMRPLYQVCREILQKFDRGTQPTLTSLQNLLLTFDLNPTLDDEQFLSLSLTQRLRKYGLELDDAEALTTDVRQAGRNELWGFLEKEPDLTVLQNLNLSEAVDYLIPHLLDVNPQYR